MLVITNYWINPLNSFHFPSRLRVFSSIHSLVCGYLDIYFHASVLVMKGWCVYCLNEWTAHNTSLCKIKDPEHEIRPFFSLIQIRNMTISRNSGSTTFREVRFNPLLLDSQLDLNNSKRAGLWQWNYFCSKFFKYLYIRAYFTLNIFLLTTFQ